MHVPYRAYLPVGALCARGVHLFFFRPFVQAAPTVVVAVVIVVVVIVVIVVGGWRGSARGWGWRWCWGGSASPPCLIRRAPAYLWNIIATAQRLVTEQHLRRVRGQAPMIFTQYVSGKNNTNIPQLLRTTPSSATKMCMPFMCIRFSVPSIHASTASVCDTVAK